MGISPSINHSLAVCLSGIPNRTEPKWRRGKRREGEGRDASRQQRRYCTYFNKSYVRACMIPYVQHTNIHTHTHTDIHKHTHTATDNIYWRIGPQILSYLIFPCPHCTALLCTQPMTALQLLDELKLIDLNWFSLHHFYCFSTFSVWNFVRFKSSDSTAGHIEEHLSLVL